MYRGFIKRLIDFILSLTGFIVLFPILLVVTVVLIVVYKGNPFFVQPRPGRNGEIFKVIKFRTMSDSKDHKGALLPPEERITGVGKLVRTTSLDEIPQLINVIKGDMSLIGPRPLLEEYLPLYNEFQMKRHDVRPGITGWAQINGRNAISWEEKFKLDVYYVENFSFLLDMKILFATIIQVFQRKDINNSPQVMMEKFSGNA